MKKSISEFEREVQRIIEDKNQTIQEFKSQIEQSERTHLENEKKLKESMEKYQSVGQAIPKLETALDDKKKDLKQEVKPEKEKTIKKNNNSLLPKKRESSKKSLGIS